MTEWEKTKALKCVQPIGAFYVCVLPGSVLNRICFKDIRRLEAREIERYVGIQRELNPKRVQEIRQYVTNVDATFPSAVILAVQSKHVRFNDKTGEMQIEASGDVAKIIDGQHRIDGLNGFEGTFECPVVMFVDMELQDQGTVFATINLKQTKVPKSIAYDLFELERLRSPQKTCHQIARTLNFDDESPLYHRIKILGKAVEDDDDALLQNLTQAAVVDRLLPFITRDPMKDRDTLRRGKTLEPATGKDEQVLIFRGLFIAGDDSSIAKIVWNYFSAIRERWPDAWDATDKGMVLNRTLGFAAFTRFLRDLYLVYGKANTVISADAFGKMLSKVNIKDSDFNKTNYEPGSSGEAKLLRDLRASLGLSKD